MTTYPKSSRKSRLDSHILHIETSDSTILIKKLEASRKNLLLIITHSYLVTNLDFTEAPDYQIHLFNEEGEGVEIKWALNNTAPFIISTRYKTILLTQLKTQ